jgi:hypothetical protein
MSKRKKPEEPSWIGALLPAIVQGLIRAVLDELLNRGGRGLL